MPRFVHGPLLGGMLAAVTLSCCAGTSFGQASPGVDAGTRVDLILERGRFLEPLPFDVQFYLYGSAPPDLVYARGRFARLTKALRRCEQVLPPMPATADPVTVGTPPPQEGLAQSPPARRDDPRPPPIHVIDVARPFTDENKTVFELSVESLDPNQEYCFEFEMFYKIEAEEARAAGFQGIDSALRSVAGDEGKAAAPAAYDRMRRENSEAIQAIRARKEAEKGIRLDIVPVRDAFFDTRQPAEILPAPFRREFEKTLDSQAASIETARQYGAAAADAQLAADALVNDPAFGRMVQQVSARATSSALALRMTSRPSALGIVNRPEKLAAPFGLSPDARAAAPVEQMWDPKAVGTRVTNLEERIREFAALRDLAKDLADQPGLRNAAGLGAPAGAAPNPNELSSDELSNVAARAEDARDRVEAARNLLELLQTSLNDRAAAIASMTEQLAVASSQIVAFRGTTISDWKTRASQYISADVGLASAPTIDSTFFYVGTNFYTGAVNKRARLRWGDQSFRKRFAFLFAIPLNPFQEDQTVDQLANASQKIEGVIGGRPLLMGAGWRLTDVVRFTGGSVLFRVKGANPLVDTKPEPHFTWFMSMSVDWDIKHFFSGLAGQTPGKSQSSVAR